MVNKATNIKNISLFIAIPAMSNLLLMAFYFSGNDVLQQIISPNNGFLTRESGLLEHLQNVYLFGVFLLFLYFSVMRVKPAEKLFFLFLSLMFIFLFLEEIDYGINLYEFLTNRNSSQLKRNWHNESLNGNRQNVRYFKQLIDLANLLWFVLLPLIATTVKIPFVKCLIPNQFFILGFILTLVYSNLAHALHDAGLGVIDGVSGSLAGNISEFREHNTYYLYLLYAFQISRAKLTLTLK